MKIYIASSWKNQHGVEMLTSLLRAKGYAVISWIENNFGENHNHVTKKFSFEQWMLTPDSNQSFLFDTNGAMQSDIVIYYGPAGQDASAELGAAYATNSMIFGLSAKDENLGLMRKMVHSWFERYGDLLDAVDHYSSLSPVERMMMRNETAARLILEPQQ